MSDLTFAQRLGASVAFDPTTKIVSLNLNDLSSIVISGVDYGLNVSAMTDTNKDSYASRIIWALLLLSQKNQAVDNNDNTIGLYITNAGKRTAVRNNVSQFGYQLLATGYVNDILGVNLDPDAIGS